MQRQQKKKKKNKGKEIRLEECRCRVLYGGVGGDGRGGGPLLSLEFTLFTPDEVEVNVTMQ